MTKHFYRRFRNEEEYDKILFMQQIDMHLPLAQQNRPESPIRKNTKTKSVTIRKGLKQQKTNSTISNRMRNTEMSRQASAAMGSDKHGMSTEDGDKKVKNT